MNEEIQRVKQKLGIVGRNPSLDRAISIALQIAPTDMSVLIVGESGVGKEFFPKIIHSASQRKHKSYFAVNCGALPEGTVDSELFGHRKGSFTGAIADRKGYFEEADGGTLFLDEVGELPLATQVRLLRVLETGEFIPVGASKPQKTDVRIVAATNLNMQEAIQNGTFREDLYFRLNTVPITIPPLRERAEDIPLLFRMFAVISSEKYRMPQLELSEEAKLLLMQYQWPGNIRELRNLTDQMSILESDRWVTEEMLKKYLPEKSYSSKTISLLPSLKKEDKHSFSSEREILYQVLFDMKRDIAELRMAVSDLSQGKPTQMSSYSESSKSLEHLFPSTHPSAITPLSPNPHNTDTRREPEEADIVEVAEHIEKEEEEQKPISLVEAEKRVIQEALLRHEGNRKEAAKDLDISLRTLYRKIKEHEIIV